MRGPMRIFGRKLTTAIWPTVCDPEEIAETIAAQLGRKIRQRKGRD